MIYILYKLNERLVRGARMRYRNEEQHQEKKIEYMVKCYECYAENGLNGTGVKTLAKACGCTPGNLYTYFNDLDDLIVQSTEYCMTMVEQEFMERAPKDRSDVVRFIEEIPYWTAKHHGKKYRLMYQIYTHPKYNEYGKKFFQGVNRRYTEYAKQMESRINIPYQITTPLIFVFVRACIHFSLFDDEYYLKSQMELIKLGVQQITEQYEFHVEDAFWKHDDLWQ